MRSRMKAWTVMRIANRITTALGVEPGGESIQARGNPTQALSVDALLGWEGFLLDFCNGFRMDQNRRQHAG